MPHPTAIHLKPAAELADRVLLPGDPHRALAVAQALLESPRMFNHHRGLWGYTGRAPDGLPLTVQATGMGGPSTAIVVEELLDLGARMLVRIGTCGALAPDLRLGELVVASAIVPGDGTSAALGAVGPLEPDPRLTRALLDAASVRGDVRHGLVASTDLFYEDRAEAMAGWRAQSAVCVEMEAATILRIADRRGAVAACLLAVTDLLSGDGREGRTRADREAIAEAGIRLGDVAVDALMSLSAATPGSEAAPPLSSYD